MSESICLPVLIAGERLEPDSDLVCLTYEGGAEVRLPRLDDQAARRMIEVDQAPLRGLSIDDITIFFDRVGEAWRNPENPWRRLALEWGSKVTGYAPAFVEWDVNVIGMTLQRAKQYDFIETDLGDPMYLDEWSRHKAGFRRCWPKGLIAHVMVGNVPMASLFTIYRSLATKNVTVTKMPRRDVITALAFALAIHETDPDHPVSRALSTAYWEPDGEVQEIVMQNADAVTVWGRAPAVESVKHRVPYGTEVIEFGPKRSFALVGRGTEDWDTAGLKAAYDTVSYDQEGCFSLQEVFVEKAVAEPLIRSLADGLSTYTERFNRRPLALDQEAHIQRARLEARGLGWEVIAPESNAWTIVRTDGPSRLAEHPLSRFVYVHPVESWDAVLPYVDRDVQTVCVEPWDRVWEIADPLTEAGADRIVPVGRMARFRPGFIHDGFHPMARMVRWSVMERDLDRKYRFMVHTPEEDEQRIYHGGARSVEEPSEIRP